MLFFTLRYYFKYPNPPSQPFLPFPFPTPPPAFPLVPAVVVIEVVVLLLTPVLLLDELLLLLSSSPIVFVIFNSKNQSNY